MATTNEKVVVAIDFGTTYSGYAYSTKVGYLRNPLKIFGNEAWPTGEGISEKTSTTILFNPEGEFKSFGFQAEDDYTQLADDDKHKDWYYFRRFKMQLLRDNHRKIGRNMKLLDETKKEMSAMKVFSEALRYLKNHFRDTVKKTGSGFQDNEIKWLITLPAIWDDGAKQFMREAAIMAGVPTDQLELALEPEAAAIFVTKDIADRPEDDAQFPLSPGTSFMIVDCGGGTVDITSSCVMADGTLKEVCAPAGGPYGGITVDKAFVSLLEEIFGKALLQNFKDSYKTEYMNLMRSFEFSKRKFKGDTMEIKISADLLSLVQLEKEGQSMERKISLSKYKDTVSFKAKVRKLIINPIVIFGLFAESRTNIVKLVKHILEQNPEIKTIVTVGGFSDSDVIYHAISEVDKSKTVIRPKQAYLAIVKGAVIYGHDKFLIISRISPFTYGINCAIPFDETLHPEWMKTIKADRILFQEALKVFIKSGDVMVPRITKAIHRFNPANPSDNLATIEVYKSKDKNTSCIYDEGCERVGKIILPLGTSDGSHGGHINKGNRIVEIIMYFGFTHLIVEANESGTNNKIEVMYECL